MHIGSGKQQFAHTEFHLNEALLQFRRLLATIQYSEVVRTEVSYVHVTSQYSNTVRKYTFLNIFTSPPNNTHTHTHNEQNPTSNLLVMFIG